MINNFSDDDTENVVSSFNDDRITLINFRNHGVIAASRNQGIKQARADWIAFLDSDDIWHPDKLDRCFAEIDETVDVIAHPLNMQRDGRTVNVYPAGPLEKTIYRELLFEGSCLTPSATMVRRTLLDAVDGYSENTDYRTAEDYELWLKLAQAGARFKILDTPLTDYRIHDTSASRSVTVHRDATLKIVSDHYSALKDRQAEDEARLTKRNALIYYGAARAFMKTGNELGTAENAKIALDLNPGLMRAYAVLASTHTTVFLWSWVAVILGIYLWQFKPMINPILRTIGFLQ